MAHASCWPNTLLIANNTQELQTNIVVSWSQAQNKTSGRELVGKNGTRLSSEHA